MEFIKWVWNFRKTRIPGIIEKLRQYSKDKDKTILILKSPKDVRQLLNNVKTFGVGYFKEGKNFS